jgi:hypothetical protein
MGAASAVSAGAGALGAVTGAIGMITGGKNKKKIAKEIANQKEAPLTNIADGMQVSTMGSDLQKQENARLAATQTSALQDGGTRALIGGVGSVAASTQDANARIAANLDEQQNNITNVRAQDEQRIQQTKEQRQANKLAALSSQYNAASQNQAQGMANIVQGAGMAANAVANGGDKTEKVNSINKKAKIYPTKGRDIYAV